MIPASHARLEIFRVMVVWLNRDSLHPRADGGEVGRVGDRGKHKLQISCFLDTTEGQSCRTLLIDTIREEDEGDLSVRVHYTQLV
jgi:hypothetical protein